MNWGTKLIFGMISFMLFITVLVTIMIRRHGEDGLIDQNYYEKGQDFDSEMKTRQATIDSSKAPVILVREDSIVIGFNTEVNYLITLKRSSNEKMDKVYKGKTTSNRFAISRTELANGPWRVRIEFQENNSLYIHETRILIK